MVTAALVAAHQLGLFSRIAKGSISAQSLAEAINPHDSTLSQSPGELKALLGFLVAHGFIDRIDDQFLPNSITLDLAATDKPYGRMMDLIAHQYLPAFFKLSDSIRSGSTAFEIAHGLPVWEYRKENSDQGRLFQEWLDLETQGLAIELAEGWNWNQYGSILDMGGGLGALARAIQTRHPSVKLTVFESPEVCEMAESRSLAHTQKAEFPLTLIKTIPGDFFKSIPGDFDAYVLKSVLHDWPDERCIELLQRLRSRMNSNQRLLVIERVTADLPNDLPAIPDASLAALDLTMFVVHGAKERAQSEWDDLFKKADLWLMSQRRFPSGLHLFELSVVGAEGGTRTLTPCGTGF
jgi:hypothetical protein